MKVPGQDKPVAFPPLTLNVGDTQFPVKDGDEVFRIGNFAKDPKGNRYSLLFEPAFGDVNEVRGLPIGVTLSAMHMHVRKIGMVVEKLFFP
jgi:hypothetical protein